MEKTFDSESVEPRWRQRWEELNIGTADAKSPRETFVIALPPPNITGVLHCGHAAGFSVQDTLARYHRMLGHEVEWCPGTDHAAIATNAVIERQLLAEGSSREELGRERFLERVDAWYAEYGGRIFEQMRRLGFTCDWSRARFTLDPQYVRAIRVVFKSLYDEGLIYRGPRIVNWCPYDRSAISDEEIEWQEHTDSLVKIRYLVEGEGEVVVATVRPETMLGDTAVAVSPHDSRYAHLVGKTAIVPIVGRRVPIIADEAVRPEFGTGVLKVTPGHDPTDYEISQRHSLPTINIIAPDGTMEVQELPQFHGKPVTQARAEVVATLRATGAFVAEEPYVHSVAHCDRCHTVIEPLISPQWWVRMATLAAPAIDVVEKGEVRFHPARYTDVYLSWMRGIRDWCISRQIWLGHAIPVSTCSNGHQFAWIDEPTECPTCHDATLVADPDVLDTWFSSALWPFAIFGWPDDTEDLRRFYPTDVLATAREIIFLWVTRMIMTGLRFAGAKPFSNVIITSTIQAADGSRMAKSKGNVVDPMAMVDQYGADAVRAWAGAVGTSGQDVRFDEDRIASYRRFANKLWNVTRFLVTRLGADGENLKEVVAPPPETLQPEDRWILSQTAEVIQRCDVSLPTYRFHDIMEQLYETVWHAFCDWYIEMIKPRLAQDDEVSRAAAAWTVTTVLDVFLRLLHPFMPFVTEECAQRLPNPASTLQQRHWPDITELGSGARDRVANERVGALIELVQAVRSAMLTRSAKMTGTRHQLTITETGVERGGVYSADSNTKRILEALLPVDITSDSIEPGDDAMAVVAGPFEARIRIRHDPEDAGRRHQQLEELNRQVARLQGQLDTPEFVARARPEIVENTRRRLAEAVQHVRALEEMLTERTS